MYHLIRCFLEKKISSGRGRQPRPTHGLWHFFLRAQDSPECLAGFACMANQRPAAAYAPSKKIWCSSHISQLSLWHHKIPGTHRINGLHAFFSLLEYYGLRWAAVITKCPRFCGSRVATRVLLFTTVHENKVTALLLEWSFHLPHVWRVLGETCCYCLTIQ